MSEFDDADLAAIEEELREVRGALVNDTITTLTPAEPVCLRETVTAQQAIERMLAEHRAGVLVVDGEGRLSGIFTERDVLTRVVGAGRDPRALSLRDVMTPNPEALRPEDRIAYAIHSMSVAGYRTVPLVDADRRPIGVVTVGDVIRWLASLFPEAVLNLPPGEALKRPGEIDGG